MTNDQKGPYVQPIAATEYSQVILKMGILGTNTEQVLNLASATV